MSALPHAEDAPQRRVDARPLGRERRELGLSRIVRFVGLPACLVVACAATAAAAETRASRAQLLADVSAETEAVRDAAGRRLAATADLTEDEVREALKKADAAATTVLFRVVAARHMKG